MSADLRKVALQWQRASGHKRMPAWRDIDPAEMATQLSIVWSWKYDRDADCFTGRLAGEEINALVGRNVRGARMQDLYSGSEYDGIFGRCKRIVSGPSLMHSYGRIFTGLGRVGCGERIALPLSEDGARSDGIIGATTYHLAPLSTLCGCPAESVCAQTVEFFPVD